MSLPRPRFTVRRMLIAILVVALLLTGYVKARGLRRREALALQLRMQSDRNNQELIRLREEAARAWRRYRAGYASGDEVRIRWEQVRAMESRDRALRDRLVEVLYGD